MNAIVSGTDLGKNPIQEVTRLHNWLFGTYMVVLVVAAILTYLVWRSGNQMQQAIQADADARIQEAREGIAKLENDNAILQRDAAEARAAQQKVELELEKQKERTATAERELLRLKENLKDRTISQGQRQKLIDTLSVAGNIAMIRAQPIEIWWAASIRDSYALALQIKDALAASGFQNITDRWLVSTTAVGFFLAIRDANNVPPHSMLLTFAFASIGIPLEGLVEPEVPANAVRILIGQKEQIA